MANIDCTKLDDTITRRIETDKLWNRIQVGKVIELKHIKKISGKVSGNKIAEVTEKYKVINKQHMRVLLQKVRNGMKETFTFADFLTGDVII